MKKAGEVISSKYTAFVEENGLIGKVFVIDLDRKMDVPSDWAIEYSSEGKSGKTDLVVKFQWDYTDITNLNRFSVKLDNIFAQLLTGINKLPKLEEIKQ